MSDYGKDGALSVLAVLLAPFVLLPTLLVLIALGILALIATPYFFLFPDHHMQDWDFKGTERQKALLVKWREAHKQLGMFGRVRRAFLVRARRRQVRRAKRILSTS